MFSSRDTHVTQPLTSGNDGSLKTIKLTVTTQLDQFSVKTTSTKLPTVIPASTKRKRTEPLEQHPLHRKHRFVLPGVLVGSSIVIIFAFLFVVPLDNNEGQHPDTIVQAIGNLISTTHFSEADALQHLTVRTTPPPAGEGACAGTTIWGTCATYF